MAFPPDIIKKPEFIWATLDETLEQIRERLERPEIKNKWRAYVLVYSDDDRYAAAPVVALQPLVWHEGPAALKRTLRESGLFSLQTGVEQDSVEPDEAIELARARGGHLVILKNGAYVGLVITATSFPTMPTEAFDLFDTALQLSAQMVPPFISATADTTVAKVAADLRALSDPKSAYIVVDMGDDSFRVVTARVLNDKIEQSGASVWARPLRHLRNVLRPAEAREIETVGQQQAQVLADNSGFLILTDQGTPIGLLPGSSTQRVTKRAAATPQDVPGSNDQTNLFTAPQSFLQEHQAEVTIKRTPRYVNLWFEDSQDCVVARTKALVQGELYTLVLNVGRLLEKSVVDWGQASSDPQAIVEPQKAAYLYVNVSSEQIDIPRPTEHLWLPQEGDSEVVRIQIRPMKSSWGEDPARLEVGIYYRAHLVQMFTVRIDVVSESERTHLTRPQEAKLTHARSLRFPEMAHLVPHDLSLTITRDGNDRYRLTLLVDPDPEDVESSERAIELSCLVRLTRDDLTHLITKARRQLHNVVRTFDLITVQDVLTFRKATRALAQVGRQLYLKLFEGDSAQILAEWMESNLTDGSTIQVIDLAGDFVFPWSLVYTEQPWDEDRPIDVTKFWGWRYELVILTGRMLDTYEQSELAITTDDPIKISVGLYDRLKGVDKQRRFFGNLNARTSHRVKPEILTDRRTMSQALKEANRDIYYFFCHGYTERIATDIQLDADLVQRFSQCAGASLADKSQSTRDHLDDLFDVSDSWLRLTHGRLPLTMLKETVPDELVEHPLIFLNMCESAQVLPSLSDGFVPFFIERGARAVLGTECAMNTVFADEFARSFLTGFLGGQPAGQILLALRRYYLEQGNPLALAYTLYCDAGLRLAEPLLSLTGGAPQPTVQPLPAPSTAKKRPEQVREERIAAVDALWQNDMDGLMLTLAARIQAAQNGMARDELLRWIPPEGIFAMDIKAGPEWTERMRLFGEQWWDKLEPRLFALLCTPSPERDTFIAALAEGARMLAVALAPALVTHAAALPAVAIVLATIAAKKIADAGLEAACDLWQGSLEGAGSGTETA